MLKFVKILGSFSKTVEALFPLGVYRIREDFTSLIVYQSEKLGITYILPFPWCKNKEIEKCKDALQDLPTLKIWLVLYLPLAGWNRQRFIETNTQTRCYFYQIKKGRCVAFDRRKLSIEEKEIYITHPFSINLEKPYETGLQGDFAFRMKQDRNFAKAINQRLSFLKNRPARWKSLTKKNTYKTGFLALYEFLLKKLER